MIDGNVIDSFIMLFSLIYNATAISVFVLRARIVVRYPYRDYAFPLAFIGFVLLVLGVAAQRAKEKKE